MKMTHRVASYQCLFCLVNVYILLGFSKDLQPGQNLIQYVASFVFELVSSKRYKLACAPIKDKSA